GGHRWGVLEVELRAGGREKTELDERLRDRLRVPPRLGVVALARGVQHHEEREQQRDEVGVGDQPALVVDVGVVGAPAAAVHPRAARAISGAASSLPGALAATAFFSSAGLRYPESRVCSIRGFMPSRIPTTPSSISSRFRSFCRRRNLIFPAIGRKARLAIATP